MGPHRSVSRTRRTKCTVLWCSYSSCQDSARLVRLLVPLRLQSGLKGSLRNTISEEQQTIMKDSLLQFTGTSMTMGRAKFVLTRLYVAVRRVGPSSPNVPDAALGDGPRDEDDNY
jgi:hypothetical protein